MLALAADAKVRAGSTEFEQQSDETKLRVLFRVFRVLGLGFRVLGLGRQLVRGGSRQY